MKKLRVVRRRDSFGLNSNGGYFRTCVVEEIILESGERLKRGCGVRGMVDSGIGSHCLICGNNIFHSDSKLDSLWFYFKTGREYWKASHRFCQDYINGIPVDHPVDRIPKSLLADLDEPDPPDWFFYYIVYDEDRFIKYLENHSHAK